MLSPHLLWDTHLPEAPHARRRMPRCAVIAMSVSLALIALLVVVVLFAVVTHLGHDVSSVGGGG